MIGGSKPLHPLVQPLGRLAFNFPILEALVSYYTWMMINQEDQRIGQIVTSQVPFRTIVDMFCLLFRLNLELKLDQSQSADCLAELEAIRKRLGSIEEARNAEMHSIHTGPDSDGMFRVKYTARAKKGFDVTFDVVTVESVNAISDEIGPLRHDVGALMARAFGSSASPVEDLLAETEKSSKIQLE